MGGGGGDGDGERACLEDLGLALGGAEGEPSCSGFGSGLFVSLEEASPESLSVAADFGVVAESGEEGEGRGEAVRWRGMIHHFGLEKDSRALEGFQSSCFHPLRSTSVAFRSGVGGGGRRGGRRGGGKSGRIRKVQTILDHSRFIFFSSPTLLKPSVLSVICSVVRSVAPIRSAFPIIHRTLPKLKLRSAVSKP